MLITCSSAASWVLDNIINNRGGLYDRTTCEIHLSPFTLQECEQYLHSKDIQLDRYSQALSYMTVLSARTSKLLPSKREETFVAVRSMRRSGLSLP